MAGHWTGAALKLHQLNQHLNDCQRLCRVLQTGSFFDCEAGPRQTVRDLENRSRR